jgi:hypothetical protein
MKQDLLDEEFIQYCCMVADNYRKNLQHQIIPLGDI